MRIDKLFANGLMRLAACAMMSICIVQELFCAEFSPINPAFKKWQKERERKAVDRSAATTSETQRTRRRLMSGEEPDVCELGFAPGTFDSSYLSSINVNSQQGVQGGFDSRYDLREHSVLTTVKDQNPYGTCWAHATCASLESWLLKSGVGTFDFSENNMANLHGGDWGFDDGGNGDRASAYLLRWGGPVLESQDPYPNCGGSTEKAPSRHVQNVRWIPGRTSYLDNDAIKQAIIDFGATYVTYHHSSSYYKPSTASYYFYGNTSRSSNHAVAIVGWDDDYPASKFAESPPGNGAFIVRNSWGTYWGEDGYFYVSYYDESFAWKTLYSFSNAEPTDNYDSIYEYDPLGLVSSFGYSSSTAWGANMFQATSATKISAVGFYAMTPNTTYTIYVYTGSTAGAPRSGTLATTQSGKSAYAGYVTVPLSLPVPVSARQRFSVVLQLTTPGYNYPLAIEYSYPGYTSDATASSGQSFFSSNGSSWTDFTSWQGSANFCCKAYTKSAPPPAATLTSIAISGVTSLTSGQSAQFSCEATYSDGSKKAVSPTWSIARAGQSYATVSASGLVTAKEVSAQQTVTVQASYTESGVTKDAVWGLYVTIAAPSAPTGVAATQGTEPSCVRVNWTAPSGATEYAVYRATANNSKNAKYLENVTVPRYNDTSAVPGIDYWYFIKAKNSSGMSGFSAGASGWRKLSPPDVTASDDLLDKVTVSWSEVEGATHYRVYRATSMDGAKTALGSGWQTATTFNDTTATPGVTYCYFVVAAVNASGSRPSDYSIVEDGMMAIPVTIDRLELKGDATINAGAHADYTADAIYSDGHKVSNITPGSWEIVGEGASVVGCQVSAATVTENKTVVLKATYTEGGKTVRGEKQIAIAAVKPVAPRNVAATAEAQGVTLTWSAVAGAASYAIYRDGVVAGRVIPNAPDAPATTYTDNTAVPGVTYGYCVAAANGAGEGPQSSPAVTAAIPLSAPTGVTATNDRTDGVLVSWEGVNGATHYRVSRAASVDGAKTVLGSWIAGKSHLDNSAAADIEYYYFVHAATDSDGANASACSAGAQGMRKTAVTISSIAISGPDKVASSGEAVYSCTATYSDGTAKPVSPVWSAYGAGTIEASGKLTAQAVASDATVAVSAAYGGKPAVKTVKVVAPVAASASVSNVSVKPRWPFSTLVDIDYTLVTEPEGTKALITVSGQDNDHNLPLAANTLAGDGADGAVSAGIRRITWDIGADYPGFHAATFDVKIEAVPYVIAAPANVSASQGTSTSGVNLSWDAVEDATGYEIWRASGSMNTADAVLVTNVEAAVAYEDTSVNPGDIYFYWFKTVTQYGTGDFSASVFGYRARVVGTVVFDANGGTASAYSLGYTAGSPYGTLPTASRTGYEFAGWFTSATGGSEVTAATPADENIATLYARWTPHTYTIHFDANGGTGTMVDIEMTYDMATNLTANAFSNNGWVFTGWATSANGEVAYVDRARVTNLSASDGATVTLFAVWGLAAPANIRHSTSSYCEESLSSTGVVKVVWHERHCLDWDTAEGAASYKVFRNTANDLSSATLLATVTGTSYGFDGTGKEPTYYYWVVAVKGASSAASDAFTVAESMVNLMPLRNLLTIIEAMNPDGVLEDNEINKAINDPRYSDADGDPTTNSPEEMYIYTRIKALNADKQLISDVIRGDYTNIGGSTLLELFELSECCRGVRGGNYSSVVLFPKRPSNVSATQQNYGTAKVVVSWTGITDAQGYEVWRSVTEDFSSGVTKVADVTTTSYTDTNVSYRSPYSYMILAKYADGSRLFSPTYAYGYWGDWCFADIGDGDILPLRNVLCLLDFSFIGDRDGYLDDFELSEALTNASVANLDGNSSVVSDAEKAVFTRIQALNTDKELIHSVMAGDFTYRGMTLAQMREVCDISDTIKELTKNRN